MKEVWASVCRLSALRRCVWVTWGNSGVLSIGRRIESPGSPGSDRQRRVEWAKDDLYGDRCARSFWREEMGIRAGQAKY